MQLTITEIRSAGRSWTPRGSNDPLYPFAITFDDGSFGEANSKSEQPPYRVGDTVDVTITGQTPRGVNKIKVQKPGYGGPQGRNPAPQSRNSGPAGQRPPLAQNRPANAGGGAILGVTVGMAVNNACAMMLEKVPSPEDIGTPEYWREVWEHASSILRIAAVLEKGKLAPNSVAKEEPETEPEPEPEPQPEPARPTARTRPAPTDDGSAFGSGNEGDGEVPF